MKCSALGHYNETSLSVIYRKIYLARLLRFSCASCVRPLPLSQESEGQGHATIPIPLPEAVYLVRGSVWVLPFVEPVKRDRPKKPDGPDPRHTLGNS